jgi:hypothetical protein
LPISLERAESYAPVVDKPLFSAESVTSNRIYLWSKRLGAALLVAMAIVAAGNAQQPSAAEKGKVDVVRGHNLLSCWPIDSGRIEPKSEINIMVRKSASDFPAGRWF